MGSIYSKMSIQQNVVPNQTRLATCHALVASVGEGGRSACLQQPGLDAARRGLGRDRTKNRSRDDRGE